MIATEQTLLIAGVLLLFGILSSRLSSRLGVPALLFFLLIGMFAGSEGIGGIPFDDSRLAETIGVIALAFILFSGGLETDSGSIRRVARQGISLATLGVFLTALLTGVFSSWVLGLPVLDGFLLGAIISSTDAAAVFAVLRSQRIGLKGDTRYLLEFESGSNDPMAIFLTTATLTLLANPAYSPLSQFGAFVVQMALGAACGYGIGRVAIAFLNWLRLEADGLYAVVTIALVLIGFSITSLVGGNGFLAVYVAGITLSAGDFIHKRSLLRFHDGLAWLMQIVMFLVLGLLVFPSKLMTVALPGLLIAAFLMLIARPIAVFLGLALSNVSLRQKLLVSWVGLRGAVPIVLATFPYQAGYANADIFFHVIFFAVIASVLLQGTMIAPVARWLKLDVPLPKRHRYPIEYVPAPRLGSDLVEISVPDTAHSIGKRIMDLSLPESALVVLIGRGDDFVAPRGGTEIEKGDQMLVLARKEDVGRVRTAIVSSVNPKSSIQTTPTG